MCFAGQTAAHSFRGTPPPPAIPHAHNQVEMEGTEQSGRVSGSDLWHPSLEWDQCAGSRSGKCCPCARFCAHDSMQLRLLMHAAPCTWQGAKGRILEASRSPRWLKLRVLTRSFERAAACLAGPTRSRSRSIALICRGPAHNRGVASVASGRWWSRHGVAASHSRCGPRL